MSHKQALRSAAKLRSLTLGGSMNKYLTFSFIAIVGVCGWWLSSVLDERTSLRDDVEQLKAEVVRQSAIIKRSNENASFYNLVTKQLINAEAQSRHEEEQRQDEYKKIIDQSSLCDNAIPKPVTDGLRARADSLRARALSADTGEAARKGISTSTAR